jgi:uncharacterized protein YegL
MNHNLKGNSNNIRKFGAGFLAMLMIMVSMSTMIFFVTSIKADDPNTSIWTTDVNGNPQNNFSPGDIVYIHGTGFTIGNNVDISINRPDGSVDVAPGGRFPESLPVVDENTNFSYEYDLDGVLGAYSIHAYDGTNYAEFAFTDASYIVESYSDNTYTTIKDFFNTGETVYGKGEKDGATTYMRLRFYDPSGNLKKELVSSVKVNTFTCDYTLPSDAATGEWDIRFYTSSSLSNPIWSLRDEDHFYVGIEYVDNPDLPYSCGINIVLIVDSSASISSTELTQMKNAYKSFVDALLPYTPTYMAVVDFDTTATLRQGYTNNVALLKAAINACTSGGYTNWQDALVKAHNTFPTRPRPNKPTLYIFSSDGNPNRWGPIGNMPNNYKRATIEAINQSNIVKDDGVRIITLGVGVGTELDDGRLKAISSDDAYYSVADFGQLSDVLLSLVSELCGGTIFIKKYINHQNASGWQFTAQVTTSGASVTPPNPTVTDENGTAMFDIQFDPGVTTANVNIIETLQPGYMLKNATAKACDGDQLGTPGANGIYNIAVSKLCFINCVFNNTEIPPPVTTKEYGSPKCIKDSNTYITSHTPIYLNTTYLGNYYVIHYRVWCQSGWSSWINGAPNTNVAFILNDLGSPWNQNCKHFIEYYADDSTAGKVETTHNQTFYVDNLGPSVGKEIGQPQYNHDGMNFVTTNTKIWLNATSGGGCDATQTAIRYIIRWWNNNAWVEVANKNIQGSKTWFYFTEGCKHELEFWAVDCLGNEGQHTIQTHYVDIEKPLNGTWDFIGPHFVKDGIDYITSQTIKRINVSDAGCGVGGAGVAKIDWSVKDKDMNVIASGTVRDGYNDGFSNAKVVVTGDNDPNPGKVSIGVTIKEDCVHYIYHKATDYLGNVGNNVAQVVRVDNKPPIVTKEVGKPSCNTDGTYCVTKNTRIWINATDDPSNSPCNVGSVDLTIGIWYNGVWNKTTYHVNSGSKKVSFTFEGAGVGGDCVHYVTYSAKDDLGNSIAEDNETFIVSSSTPQIIKQVGNPHCIVNQNTYCVKTTTPIYIDALIPLQGCYCPGLTVQYSLDKGGWITINVPYTYYFPIVCSHTLDIRAFDCRGVMVYDNESFYVDDTPPGKPIKTVGEPNAKLENDSMGHEQWLVFEGTMISFATPPGGGCCPSQNVDIQYRIWYLGVWSGWTDYTGSITLTGGCVHYLEARAIDCLGNIGEVDNETFWVCAPGGGEGDPIDIVYPQDGLTVNNGTLDVIIHAYDYLAQWPDLNVNLWIPGGRRDAPYLFYDVEPTDQVDYYIAHVPIYNYQDGAQITLQAGARDINGMYTESLPVTFTVDSTILWDQWMQNGWNLLTLPPNIGCNESVERVLSSIQGSYDAVFYYDYNKGWTSYWIGDEENELTEINGGKQYWVHITNEEGLRYYIGLPEIEIQSPVGGSTIENLVELDQIHGIAWNSEIGINEVAIKLSYTIGSTNYYWTGSDWGTSAVSLPCVLDNFEEYYIQNWIYDSSNVDWSKSETYKITATATDAYGCKTIDEISFSITKYHISGTISYYGSGDENIFVELIDESHPNFKCIDYISGPGPYTLSAPNGEYYVVAFMDLNGNHHYESTTEPAGAYGDDPPEPIIVNGADIYNIDFTLYDPS